MYRFEVFSTPEELDKVMVKAGELGLTAYVDEVVMNDRRVVRSVILVPDGMVDKAMRRFMEAVDLRRSENAVVVSRIEAGASARFRLLSRRPVEGLMRPLEGILEEARRLSSPRASSLVLGAVAALVALAGFVLSNPVIIVGAMLISPVLGPIYGFAVSVSLGRIRDALRALYSLALLMASIIAVAAAAALIADAAWGLEATGEALSRAEPGMVYLAVALLLGGAGAVAVVEREHEALAGVAIAAALVPPAAAAGMGLGLRLLDMAVGASLLVAENIVGMMAGSLAALQLLGLEPRRYYDRQAAKMYLARTAAVLILLILVLIVILA